MGVRPATEDLITTRDMTGSIGGPINARQAVVLRERPHAS